MAKCKKCGRILEDKEGKTCPACRSESAWRWKTAGKVVSVVAAVAVITVRKILR